MTSKEAYQIKKDNPLTIEEQIQDYCKKKEQEKNRVKYAKLYRPGKAFQY